MPANQLLPTRELFLNELVPVMICSAAGPCPICREDYVGIDHAPVLVRPCGHIFGKPCILKWLEGDTNTCPLDMGKLFTSTPDLCEAERWSIVSFSDSFSRRGGVSGESGRTGEITQRTNQTQDQHMFWGGEIISVNGHLTLEGCLRIICNLWYHNEHLYLRMHDHADELDVLSVSDDVLREPILGALPQGIELEESAWPLLFSVSRTMLSWKQAAWEQGWDATMPEGYMGDWGEELYTACGSIRNEN